MASAGFRTRQLARDIKEQFGPDEVMKAFLQIFGRMQRDPSFGALIQDIGARSAAGETQTARFLGRTGMAGTPIGAIRRGMGAATGGLEMARARGQLYGPALQSALGLVGKQAGTFGFTLPSYLQATQPIGNQLLGYGLGAAGMALPGGYKALLGLLKRGGGGQQGFPPFSPDAPFGG